VQNQTIRLLALSLLFGSFATATSAVQKAKSKKASDTKAPQAAEKALRLKVVGNIESIVAKLNLSSAQKAKVKALTSESQWKQAVTAFETSRGTEIHDHAHQIVPKTIPGMMQKFMPVGSKNSADRKAL